MHTDQCLECLLRREVYLSYCLRLSIPVQGQRTRETEEVAPEAALEPATVDNMVMRTNLLEIGMRRLQRDFEVHRLNEAIAAQAAEDSGDEEEESEEAEEERA
ncbi:UNVERIFIED_CONTAM: hypothetical protein K2H54_065638 [Gekko kuhli]